MKNRQLFIWGTFLLTLSGFLSRIIGFFYRIFLSHTIGAEGVGLYQLISPVLLFLSAIAVSGIQAAISRCTAARLAVGDTQGANDTFLLGSALSLALSCLLGFCLYRYSDGISIHLLEEPRTSSLLKVLAFGIPFGSLHTCVNSYYLARKNPLFPSASQLLEQLVRVGSSYLIYRILLSQNLTATPLIAVSGGVMAELAAMLFSVLAVSISLEKQRYRFRRMQTPLQTLEKISSIAYPLTLNRVLLTFLHSMEAVLIPSRLKMTGFSPQAALSTYGILTGMALPMIFFPCAITNSAAVMLMPSIAEKQALGSVQSIRKTTELTIRTCFSLGLLCTGGFFLLGPVVGSFLFKTHQVGPFLRTLSFICPFLYMNTTLLSILNGLGKTKLTLLHNSISVGIRIFFVLFAIPLTGIKGYLWGILLGELTLSLLLLLSLRKEIQIFC